MFKKTYSADVLDLVRLFGLKEDTQITSIFCDTEEEKVYFEMETKKEDHSPFTDLDEINAAREVRKMINSRFEKVAEETQKLSDVWKLRNNNK